MTRLPPIGLCPGNEAVIRRSLELGGRFFTVPAAGAILPPPELVAVPYNLLEQKEANGRIAALKREGKRVAAVHALAGGRLVDGRLDPRHAGYRALARKGRTLVQAAIQFVLANESVECAIVRVTRPEHVEEVLRATDVEPLSGQDLELIFELWANRFD